MSYELRILNSALCIMNYEFCIMHSALCILHYAFCIMHSALFQEFLYIIRTQFVLMRLEAVAGAKYDVEL